MVALLSTFIAEKWLSSVKANPFIAFRAKPPHSDIK